MKDLITNKLIWLCRFCLEILPTKFKLERARWKMAFRCKSRMYIRRLRTLTDTLTCRNMVFSSAIYFLDWNVIQIAMPEERVMNPINVHFTSTNQVHVFGKGGYVCRKRSICIVFQSNMTKWYFFVHLKFLQRYKL